MARRVAAAAALAAAAVGSGAAVADAAPADRLPRGGERVTLDPADFTTRITNPYWPMRPGTAGSTARPTPAVPGSGWS